MRYRVTCLTPTLVGDGQRLSPIDYMVWKDHVNVLDQRRIFRLLAKGPRLDGYLAQLKKSDKLDFASWGGFAQNFAGRRIPFEDPGAAQFLNRASQPDMFIPTFATVTAGPYLPASALKGALRTAFVHGRWNERATKELAERAASGDPRAFRRPGLGVEDVTLGPGGANAMRAILPADSAPIAETQFKIYLLRTSTLESRGGQGKYELAWKTSPRGSVPGRRPDDSTPTFAEMAVPGATFEGAWQENEFIKRGGRTAGNPRVPDRSAILQAANDYAAEALALHRRYAEWSGLGLLGAAISELEQRVTNMRASGGGCVLPLGWAAGFLSKVANLDTTDEPFRQVLRQVTFYARAVQSGLPFPKTRRIVFLGNQPATLAGWVLLEIS
ncbi:MAG: RAMP superfamily CRISPR-associated protein [Bryobacteraceae bacterium]